MQTTTNIIPVVDKGLCNGCGTCASVCPHSAIKIKLDSRSGTYKPMLSKKECKGCGFCASVCYLNSNNDLNQTCSNGKIKKYLGNITSCYIGHSNEYSIRYNSASGGLATTLLIYALEKRLIDGALVTKMKADCSLETEPVIAKTKDEIIKASKSKYCPAATNVALSEIMRSPGTYAVVGLPCHIKGIEKASHIIKDIKKKVLLKIGIFCSRTWNYRASLTLLRCLGIDRQNVKHITYRGNGWPGTTVIEMINGERQIIPNSDPLINSIFTSYFFTPLACLICDDFSNESADISLGDPWGLISDEQIGKSLIIARTEKGKELLETLSSQGIITLSKIEPNSVVMSQIMYCHFKKINIDARINLLHLLGITSAKRKKTDIYNLAASTFPIACSLLGAKVNLEHALPSKFLTCSNLLYKPYSLLIRRDFYTKGKK